MTYLVTGSEGFIGRNLEKTLLKKDSVIGFDYKDLDLCVDKMPNFKVSTIIHLAAETSISDSLKNPEKTFLRNCASTIKMLEFARSTKAWFIFISSVSAADSSSPYGASKLACESICKAYRESYDVGVSILRLSNVYGPHSIHKTSVVHRFIKSIFDGEPMQIHGDGLQTRDFIYVGDICRAIRTVPLGNLNVVSTGFPTKIIDLAYRLKSLANLLLKIDTPIIHTTELCGKTHPAIEDSSFNTLPLADGLFKTFKWYMENYKHGYKTKSLERSASQAG